MSEQELKDQTAPSGGKQETAAADSVLQSLKKRRQSISADRRLDLDVPGYEGTLVARYKPVPWDQLKKIAERAETSSNQRKELNAQADTIATACDTLLVQIEDELIPLHEAYPDVFGDRPAKYDERLGALLGFEAKSSRQAVFGLFRNDLAVTAHQNEIGVWQQSSRNEDDEAF